MEELETQADTLVLMHFTGKKPHTDLYRVYRLVPQPEDSEGCYLSYFGSKYAYSPDPKNIAGKSLSETALRFWAWKTWESHKRGYDVAVCFLFLEEGETEMVSPLAQRPFRFATLEEIETLTALYNLFEHNRRGITVPL